MPATAQVRIGADTKVFRRAMEDINKRFKELNKNVGVVRKSLGALGSAFGSLGKVGSFVGLPGLIGASAYAFSKFEKNVAEVYTLLPKANRQAFEEMSRDALKFSEKFGVMPEEVTRGMYQAISAGVKPETLMDDNEFLDVAQKSAVAGVTDLKTAVDALTNVTNSYGEGVYDVREVADMMFKAVSMSKTTFRELSDYMYQILPTAGSLKIRLDDLLGSISALAATGTLTRVGTTQLRQMFIELGRTGDKANSAFLQASGGTPFQQFIRDGGRVTEVIAMIGNVAKSRGTDLRNLFGSVEAGNAAINLFTSRSVQGMIDALDEDTGAAAGAMSDAFKKIADTVSFKFGQVTRSIMNTAVKLGMVLKPALMDVLSIAKVVGDKLTNLDWKSISRTFAYYWTGIRGLIAKGDFWSTFLKLTKTAFMGITLIAYKAIRSIFNFIKNNIFSVNFSDIFSNFSGVLTLVSSAVSAFFTGFVSQVDRLLPRFDGISDAITNALMVAFVQVRVMFGRMVDDMMRMLATNPIFGDQVSKMLFEAQYPDKEKALEEAQSTVGYRENAPTVATGLGYELKGLTPFSGALPDKLKENAIDFYTDKLKDLRKSYSDAVTDYNNEVDKVGQGEKIESISYDDIFKGGKVDIPMLNELEENFKKFAVEGVTANDFTSRFGKDAFEQFNEYKSGLENALLVGAGRAQAKEEDKPKIRKEDQKESAVSESVTNTIEIRESKSETKSVESRETKVENQVQQQSKKSVPDAEKGGFKFASVMEEIKEQMGIKETIKSAFGFGTDVTSSAVEKVDDFAKNAEGKLENALTALTDGLTKLGSAVTGAATGIDTEKLEKKLFADLGDIFALIGKNAVLPDEKEEAKYTDGGIKLSPQQQMWNLINPAAKPVVDSLQKIGGGGNVGSADNTLKDRLDFLDKKKGVMGLNEAEEKERKKLQEKKDKEDRSPEVEATLSLGELIDKGLKDLSKTIREFFSNKKDQATPAPVKKETKKAIEILDNKQTKLLPSAEAMPRLEPLDSNNTSTNRVFEKLETVMTKYEQLVDRQAEVMDETSKEQPINF